MESGGHEDVAFHPRQQWFEAILLSSPKQPLPIFCIVTVLVAAVLKQTSIVHETFATDPAHDGWRGNRQCQIFWLCSTVLADFHPRPVRRHLVSS